MGMAIMAASPALAQDLEDPIRDLIERLDLSNDTVAAMVVNYEQCIKEELDTATEDGFWMRTSSLMARSSVMRVLAVRSPLHSRRRT